LKLLYKRAFGFLRKNEKNGNSTGELPCRPANSLYSYKYRHGAGKQLLSKEGMRMAI
jgi:hypothetical protein